MRETPLQRDISKKHLLRATPAKVAASTLESGDSQPIIELGNRLGVWSRPNCESSGSRRAKWIQLCLNVAMQMLQHPLHREPRHQAGTHRASSHEF